MKKPYWSDEGILPTGMGKCPRCGEIRDATQIIHVGICEECIREEQQEYDKFLEEYNNLFCASPGNQFTDLTEVEYEKRLRQLIEDMGIRTDGSD